MSLRVPPSHSEGQESKAGAFSRHTAGRLSPRPCTRRSVLPVCARRWRRQLKGDGHPWPKYELLAEALSSVKNWAGEMLRVPAGTKESHFVIRCLLFSLLIPFRVSWDGKQQQIVSGSWRVALMPFPFCCVASLSPNLKCPPPAFPRATAEPLDLPASADGDGVAHRPGVCLPLVWQTLAPLPSWPLEARGGTRVRKMLSWKPTLALALQSGQRTIE